MAQLINIHQPHLGVVEDEPDASKRLNTAFSALNVLMRDTETGQARLATRPGLDPLFQVDIGQDGKPISAVFPVKWATSGENYDQLSGPDIETEWAKAADDGQPPISVAVNQRVGSYWLTEGGTIERRSSSGELVFSTFLPIQSGFTVTPRILVDPLGSVYCAASSNASGVKSHVFKFSPRVDDEGLDIEWIHEVDGKEIADICRRGGQLFLAINQPENKSHVAAVEGAGTDSPFNSWTMGTPYPLQEIAYGTGLIFTCPPNAERGDGGPINGDEDLWTLKDLPNADQRVHAIYDARLSGDFADGVRITQMIDARQAVGITPEDTTVRDLVQSHYFEPIGERGSPGPRFRTQGPDNEPSISFRPNEGFPKDNGFGYVYDNGNALWSDFLDGDFDWRVDKASPTSSLPRSRGLYPHVADQQFTLFFKVRWPLLTHPGIVYMVGAWNTDSTAPASEDGCLALIVQDQGGADVTYGDGKITLRGAVTNGADTWVTGTAKEVDGAWEAIVTIDRRTAATSRFRVNGTEVTSTMHLHQIQIANPREVWGNRIWLEGSIDENVFPLEAIDLFAGADSFTGELQYAASVFGSSSAGTDASTTHDVPCTDPEIHDIEGALAWRRADGTILDGTTHDHNAADGPPLAGTPNVIINETEVARALRSPDGIVGRLSPGQNSIPWAVSGAGIGYSVSTSAFGEVYTAGPRLAELDNDDTSPRSAIFQKLTDRGLYVEHYKPSAGEVILVGKPDDGDFFEIDPGDGTPIKFEFKTTPGADTPTHIQIQIEATGYDTASRFIEALYASEFDAPRVVEIGRQAGGRVVRSVHFQSRQAPTGTAAPITVTSPNQYLRVQSGMSGGASPSETWDVRKTLDDSLVEPRVHINNTADGDLYAMRAGGVGGASAVIVRHAKEDGAEVFVKDMGPLANFIYEVQPDPRAINFGESIDSPEFLWVAQNADQGQKKLRLVQRTPNGEAPQRSAYLIIKGGLAYAAYDDGTVSSLPMSDTFEEYDPYMQVVDFQGDLLISDGKTRMVWSPRNDTFEPWEAKRGTDIPENSKLMTAWNARVFLSGGDNPYLWTASAVGDYTDFETNPTIKSANQAISSDSGEQTQTLDQITGLVPVGDDLMLVLGANTISRMTGDPRAGGFLDNVNRDLGAPFGQAWAHESATHGGQGPTGGAFFFGVPHSVWAVAPNGMDMRNVSIKRIQKTLEKIDLKKYAIRMVYSMRMRGLCVIPIPLDHTQVFDLDWWFMGDEGAWFQQKWASRAHQPTSVSRTLDTGEPVLGCYDGVVRSLTRFDGTDDGEEFESEVTFGPYFDRQYNKLGIYYQPFARIEASSPVEWRGYVSDSVLKRGAPNGTGEFHPTEPGNGAFRQRGKAFWLQLRAFGVDWAYERGSVKRVPAGVHK